MPTMNDIRDAAPKVLDWFRDRLRPASPLPTIVGHPDGDGALVLYDQGDGKYTLKSLPGQTETIPSHTFDRFDDLVVYLLHRAGTGSLDPRQVLVCVDEDGVTAVFGDFGRVAEVAVSSVLPFDPFFEPWASAGRAMNPHATLNFLRQIPGELVGTIRGSEEPLDLRDYLITQMLKIDVNVGGETEIQMQRNGLVTVARKGKETTVNCRLPDSIRFRGPVYEGISVPHDVEVLLHLSQDEGVPFIAFEVARKKHLLRQGRKAVVEELRNQLGEGWCVALGEASSGRRTVGPQAASLLTPEPSQGA